MDKNLTLDRIAPGRRCRVTAVNGSGRISQRLMEMGLIQGCHIRVVRLAPLGDPMELHLRGYRLSLRKSEAANVEVSPCP